MFIARMVFFRLHESPRYLVHAGRPQEAIESLQLISKFNGSELSLHLEDVQDHIRAAEDASGNTSSAPSDVVFDAGEPSAEPVQALAGRRSHDVLRDLPDRNPPDYSSTGEPNVTLDEHTFQTPTIPYVPNHIDDNNENNVVESETFPEAEEPFLKHNRGRGASFHSSGSGTRPLPPRARSRSSLYEIKSKVYWRLPRAVRRPLWAWIDRVAMVLSPQWLRTTLLVWIAWWAMSLGLLNAINQLDPIEFNDYV